ncbi:hypothetical protein [Mycetocola saprophilus]|uniref:hypothetical protein n=1 Tax=Mycetocola saprophilus TaxID=76636 RepID=UPI0004C07037|nr:hypothetical protein [Mycetocola saprophilus]
MLKPTNDPLELLRRRQADEAKSTREALGASGTQPFQAVRKLKQQIEELTQFVNAIPQIVSGQANVSGWSVDTPPEAGDWTTVASVVLRRPEGRSRAVVQGIVNASAVQDTSEFGNFAMKGRIVIAGAASPNADGSLEPAASTTRSTLSLSHIRDFTTTASTVQVDIQIRGRYSNYPASNAASLSVQASFTQI